MLTVFGRIIALYMIQRFVWPFSLLAKPHQHHVNQGCTLVRSSCSIRCVYLDILWIALAVTRFWDWAQAIFLKDCFSTCRIQPELLFRLWVEQLLSTWSGFQPMKRSNNARVCTCVKLKCDSACGFVFCKAHWNQAYLSCIYTALAQHPRESTVRQPRR